MAIQIFNGKLAEVPGLVFNIVYDVGVPGFHFMISGVNVMGKYPMVRCGWMSSLRKENSDAIARYRPHGFVFKNPGDFKSEHITIIGLCFFYIKHG